MSDTVFLVIHLPSNNILAEADTRAEAEAKLNDWLDYEREDAFKIVEMTTP